MIDGARVLCVIIGRAGSKGLPGKNARPLPLVNRPTIAFSLEDAQESGCIDRIIVSTDGDEIAAVAHKHGVEVIRRPPELASDTATVDSAVRHAVEQSEDEAGVIVLLYANVPARPSGLIDRAVRCLFDTGADSVQSYCNVGKNHPFWMSRLDPEGRVTPYQPNTVYRRQELPPLFVPDGGVVVVTRQSLFTMAEGQPHAFLGRDRRGIETQPGEVIDIDTNFDAFVAAARFLHDDITFTGVDIAHR